MKKSICMYQPCVSYQVETGDLSAFMNNALKKHIDQFGSAPEAIYITSSIELSIFAFEQLNKALLPFLSSIPGAEMKVVSQGCLGLYASVIDFNENHGINSVLLFTIEAPKEFVQEGLNAIGIGDMEGQDGLVISPSIGCVSLVKTHKHNLLDTDYVIDSCEIISIPTSLSQQAFAILKMAKMIISMLGGINTKLVSFEVSAPWSESMSHVIKSMIRKKSDTEWLDSVEKDHQHYMTSKQILELVEYKNELENGPLVMTGLGVGGRFGVLRVSAAQYAYENSIPSPTINKFDFNDYVDFTRDTIINPVDDHANVIRNNVLSFNKKYRGLDNQFFSWNIDLDYCQSFVNDLALGDA